MHKGTTKKSINAGYGTITEVEMQQGQKATPEPRYDPATFVDSTSLDLSYSFAAQAIYVLTHVELATLPLLPFIALQQKRYPRHQAAMLLEGYQPASQNLPTVLGKASLPAALVTLLEGAALITERVFPAAFWGLMLHDIITFYTQVENRYGTPLINIFLGTASNNLAWSSLYGTDIATETLHWLIPAAVGLALSVSALSKLIYDRYRLTHRIATKEAIHTETSLRFLRRTALWHVNADIQLLALKRLRHLSQTPNSRLQRFRALSIIEQVASSFQPKYRQVDNAESLYGVALTALNQQADNLDDSYLQSYARYLRWSLGERNNRKENVLLLPFILISVFILAAKLRLGAMWWNKACELAAYLAAKKACEQDANVYTLTQSGYVECTVCGDWPAIYYGAIHTAQACLNSLLSQVRKPVFVLTRLSSIQVHLNRHKDIDVIDLSAQDLATAWSEPEWDAFFSVFEAIPQLHLAVVNLSTSSLNPASLSHQKLARLAKFLRQVPIDCLDVTHQALSADNLEVFLESVANNTALTELHFSSTNSGDSVACQLANLLPATRIHTLITGYNNVTDYGMACYTDVLTKTNIHTFYAPGNPITERGMLPFVRNLNRTNVRHLDISDTALSFDTVDSLGQALRILSSLYLARCQLNDQHLHHWPMYAPNATVEVYELSSNALSGKSIIPFLTAQPPQRRLAIHLAELTALNSYDYQCLGDLLTTKNIQVLNIAHNQLLCAAFTALMVNNSQLQTLIAVDNGISDACMPVFSQRLTNQTNSLRHLDLSTNNIGSVGIASLFSSLPATQLQTLNVAGNPLTGIEFRDYPHAISQSQLTALNLGHNPISAEFIVPLLHATLINTTLQKLDLSAIALNEANGVLLAQLLLPPIPHPDSLADLTLTRDQQRLLHRILTTQVKQTHLSTLNISHTQLDVKGLRALCHAAPAAHLTALSLSANSVGVTTIHPCSSSGASRTDPWLIFHLPRYGYRTFQEVLTTAPSMIAPVAAAATLLPSLTVNRYSAPVNLDLTVLAVPTLLLAILLIKALLNTRPYRPSANNKK